MTWYPNAIAADDERMEDVSYTNPLTSIVGVLHDSHELNSVVAQIPDSGQSVGGELFVRSNPVF